MRKGDRVAAMLLNCPEIFELVLACIIDDQFEPRRALAAMAAEGVTASFTVPAMWAAISRVPDFDSFDLLRLRTCLVGGALCPVPVREFFKARGFRFHEGFGMTETARSSRSWRPKTSCARTTGRLVLGPCAAARRSRRPPADAPATAPARPGAKAGYSITSIFFGPSSPTT